MSCYGWIVDVDRLAEEPVLFDSRVSTTGPRSIPAGLKQHFQLGWFPLAVVHWRCLDADGLVYYEGRYIGPGDERMFGPLEDFATPNAGATSIEYLDQDTGRWVPL